jgi:acyl carrier protein phosphodiesterase
MNYLAHAVLSFDDPELLTGNMIADHVKGRKALEQFPEGIIKGIKLHRLIDQYTDEHPATARAKLLFRPDYRLYAGAVVDSLYDHFLANDPKYFPTDASLKSFSTKTYLLLEQNAAHLPPVFAGYFPYMREHDWLYNYRNLRGVERSLNGLQRRAQHMPDALKAYQTFIGHYYYLAQCYYEFMDDVAKFVKITAL